MSLVNCHECNHEVSSLAQSCPKCGAPVAELYTAKMIGTPTMVTETTSKSLKIHIVYSTLLLLLFITGFIFGAMTGCSSTKKSDMNVLFTSFCAFGSVVSFIYLIVTKIRIWWHHH
jgi:FtsH-binding integral membrane protein